MIVSIKIMCLNVSFVLYKNVIVRYIAVTCKIQGGQGQGTGIGKERTGNGGMERRERWQKGWGTGSEKKGKR